MNPNCPKSVEKLYILGNLFFRSVQNGSQTAPGLNKLSKLASRAPKSGLANVPRGPFWGPNPFQNRLQIWSTFWCRVSVVLGPFFGPEMLQKRFPKRLLTKSPSEKPRNAKSTYLSLFFCCFLLPTWPQNGPKMDQNACQEASKNEVRTTMPKMVQK